MQKRIFDGLPTQILSIFQTRSDVDGADLVSFLEEKCFSGIELTSKQEVQQYITSYIASNSKDPEKGKHYNIYSNLVSSGWFIEYRSGYDTFVDISPDGRLFLDFLRNFKNLKARSFGREVATVLSLLETAHNDFINKHDVIFSAEESAHTFLQHLKNTSAHLHIFEQKMNHENNALNVIHNFFDEYIAKNMIEDYKKLKTQDNPFRFRFQIIHFCDLISSNAFLGLIDFSNLDTTKLAIKDSCHNIQKIFSSIGTFIELIDEFNARIERRIRNTVKYLHEINNLNSDIVLKAIELISKNDKAEIIFNESQLENPETQFLFYQPSVKTKTYSPTKINKPKKSPEFIELEKEILNYFTENNITADKIDAFLSEYLSSQTQIQGRNIPIRNLHEFYIFERLRSVEFIEGGVLKKKWSLTLLNDYIKNDWIECKDFVISRVRQ